MKGEALFEALGDVDDSYIEETEEPAEALGRKRRYRWLIPVAALCFIVIIAGAVVRYQVRKSHRLSFPMPKLDSLNVFNYPNVGMSPFFVYHGRIYDVIYTVSSEEQNYEKLLESVGEEVGHAYGSVNEYNAAGGNNWKYDFSGSWRGTIYTMKGYDPEKRLCSFDYTVKDDGTQRTRIYVFDTMDGATITTGKDYLEDFFHLSKNTSEGYQFFWSRDVDYDNDGLWEQEIHQFDVDPKVWKAFLKEMDNSYFYPLEELISESGTDESWKWQEDHLEWVECYFEDGTLLGLELGKDDSIVVIPLRGEGLCYLKVKPKVFNEFYKAYEASKQEPN